jgi:fermentation-respiration switch protein FrsA (DUF1100 family)
MKPVFFRNGSIKLAGNLHLPADFSPDRSYAAIVIAHPNGGVKEQTAGLYAAKLANEGIVMLAYDASYQGESGGEPRQEENPYVRVQDVTAAIDFLVTQTFVDQQRIGVLGICAGGGYAINAAMNDRRIKAVATVSAVNFGAMMRTGYEGAGSPTPPIESLEMAAKARTAEAQGQKMAMMPFTPSSAEEAAKAPHRDYREAYDYYHTPRAQHRNSPSVYPLHCLTQLVGYDAFHLADLLLTQPLQLVAGNLAGSLIYSQQALELAASRDKNLHVVEGAGHVDLYDVPKFVEEVMSKLAPFFKAKL